MERESHRQKIESKVDEDKVGARQNEKEAVRNCFKVR